MAGFKFHPGVAFDVLDDELVGEWHAPCASLILSKDGTGIHKNLISGASQKPESIKWRVNQSTLTIQWPSGDQTWEVVWVDEDSFQINYTPGKQEPHVWTWYRVEKKAPLIHQNRN